MISDYFASGFCIKNAIGLLITSILFFLLGKQTGRRKNNKRDKAKKMRVEKYIEASEMIQRFTKTGIWFFDIKTQEVEWSDPMYEIYDRTPGWEINLDEIDKMVLPEHKDAYIQHTTNHREGKETETFTYVVDTGISIKHLEARIIPRIIDGEIVSIFGSVQDISIRYRKEKEKEIFINDLQIRLAKQQSSEKIMEFVAKYNQQTPSK